MVRKSPEKGYFPHKIERRQAVDTGMAMVLICLLAGHLTASPKLTSLAIVLLLLNMTIPMIFKPAAVVWLGLSTILGTVMSRALLTVVFFAMVWPVGFLRRLVSREDALLRRQWKKDSASLFKVRNHTYTPGDIEKPF